MSTIRELKAKQVAALQEYHRIYRELENQIQAKRRPRKATRVSHDPNWVYMDARNEMPRHG